jgi:predicted dienelactone hydrolase
MHMMYCFLGLLVFFFLSSCAETSPATPTASAPVATAVPTQTLAPTTAITAESLTESGPYTVSTREMSFIDDDRGGEEMIIKMWYPANDNTEDAAPDLSGAPYPVVIYSHGAAYEVPNNRNSHNYLALHLASYGIVVVGVDHNDVDQAEAFTDRPLDILSVIDQLDDLAVNEFAGVLDMEKLGVMGMSLGTATTMQMGGAHLDFENANTWCLAHPNTYLCPPDPSVPEKSRALMTEVGMVDENGLSYIPTDPRIRAVALMSPAFAPIFGQRGLQSVHVPVLLLAGAHSEFYEDGEIPFIYQHLGSLDRYLISFKNGDHGYLLLPHLRAREQLMTAFFGYYLQGRQDYAPLLTEVFVNSIPGLAWGVYE